MLKTKIVSSLEKIFINSSSDSFNSLERLSCLKGERVSLQLVIDSRDDESTPHDWSLKTPVDCEIEGIPSELVTVREVKHIPVELPINYDHFDEDYLSFEPGMYPDVLMPLKWHGKALIKRNKVETIWIDITVPEDFEAGERIITVRLSNGGVAVSENSVTLDVINATLPEQTLILTQWFHCDSLASYYRVPVWSEEHWRIVENFARVAVKNGINMLLTPVFTPPLDTEVGGERLTNQLVKVTVNGGKYSFDFSLLDRWVDMCKRVGIKYYEISHLFTQWGAKAAPKVMATVDGEYKKIFGWETEATGKEYVGFLRAFLPELIAFMKSRGVDKQCYFHISDEPQKEHLEYYSAAKDSIIDLLEGYTVMDALSNYEFYSRGIVTNAVCCNDHIAPFIENKVENLWTYYCCGQCVKVSNRLIAMPSWRNRSIGMQMFKYDIVGFLHWGYNFYNAQYSIDTVNPYVDASGDHWVPAGDPFSVYPHDDGTALESLRIVVFKDALQDISAMQLCASLYSKDEVIREIERLLGYEITFETCTHSSEEMHAVRERVNEMIKAKV